jgi:hypothetical protein
VINRAADVEHTAAKHSVRLTARLAQRQTSAAFEIRERGRRGPVEKMCSGLADDGRLRVQRERHVGTARS